MNRRDFARLALLNTVPSSNSLPSTSKFTMSETKIKSIKSTKLTICKRPVFSDEFKRDKVAKLLLKT